MVRRNHTDLSLKMSTKGREDPGSVFEAVSTTKMMTSFEVDPPEFLVVKTELAKAVPLELVFENGMFINSQSQIAEQLVTTPEVLIPVTIDPDSLPYALLTKMTDPMPLQLPDAISLSLRVIQKRNIRVTLKADNLNAFSRVFGDNAELMFTLSHEGALKNWSTGRMQVVNGADEVEGSLWIEEDIDEVINQFGRRKRYKTAHGEVSSLTGTFTLKVCWKMKPRAEQVDLAKKLDRHQKLIMAKSFDHTIDLTSTNGKMFKVSKAMMAAFSEKVEKQLTFLLDEDADGRLSYKALPIFSGAQLEDGSHQALEEGGLKALIRFLTMNSILEPLSNPALALELMMVGSYNLINELERAMALVLLAQPEELFDLNTSIYLYWFSSLKFKLFEKDKKLKLFWERIRIRAAWNMKWIPISDLKKNEVFKEIFEDEADLDHFFTLV